MFTPLSGLCLGWGGGWTGEEYKRGLEMLKDLMFAGFFWLMVILAAILLPVLIRLIGGAI